jgi:hypothetical protein
MANELATGAEQYGLPLWLSLRADALDRKAKDMIND